MFWLEPKEIALRCASKKLLEAIYEVIAIDPELRMSPSTMRRARAIGSAPARRRFAGPADRRRHSGRSRTSSPPRGAGRGYARDEVCRHHVRVIASRVRIVQEQELQGWVISFRDKNDINQPEQPAQPGETLCR
ncbi:hypothetical protein M8494_01305 [Serratia ureilytica]